MNGRWRSAVALVELGSLSVTATLLGCGLDKLLSAPVAVRQGQLRFTTQPETILRQSALSPAVTVSVLDPDGMPLTSYLGSVTVRLDANPSGGTLGGTLTKPVASGVATFTDLSVDQPGDGYRLAASADSVSSAVSASFRVQDDRTIQFLAVSGDAQSDSVGAILSAPYVVAAKDELGSPVVGVTVHWSVTTGSISPATSVTDGSGGATAVRTLGGALGPESAIATLDVPSAPAVTFAATALAAAPATLAFSVQPTATNVGQPIAPAVVVRVTDRLGNPAAQFTGPIAIDFGANPSQATLGGTTTRSAANGVATFPDLTVATAGTGYTLRASLGSLAPATSAGFSVIAPVSLSLRFRQQPTDGRAKEDIDPPVTVEVRDQANNLVTSFAGAITIAIAPGTGAAGARLSGKASQPAKAGVAVFKKLSIDQPGSGYRLRARAPFGFLDSSSFTVTP